MIFFMWRIIPTSHDENTDPFVAAFVLRAAGSRATRHLHVGRPGRGGFRFGIYRSVRVDQSDGRVRAALFPDFVHSGLNGSYAVKLYRYKNSENDGGYFSIVEIDCGSKQVLRMIQTGGWDKFDPDYSPTSDYYKLVRLDDSTYALLFVGFNYASEPGLLTIVILRGGQATRVYNKDRYITSLTENPLKIHTISQFPEAVPESTHASLYEVIYQDGNLLKWRMGKN